MERLRRLFKLPARQQQQQTAAAGGNQPQQEQQRAVVHRSREASRSGAAPPPPGSSAAAGRGASAGAKPKVKWNSNSKETAAARRTKADRRKEERRRNRAKRLSDMSSKTASQSVEVSVLSQLSRGRPDDSERERLRNVQRTRHRRHARRTAAAKPNTTHTATYVNYADGSLESRTVTLHNDTARLIGNGVFSNVYRYEVELHERAGDTRMVVAVKKSFPDDMEEEAMHETLVRCHRYLDHPNITKLLFYFTTDPGEGKPCWNLAFDYMSKTVAAVESEMQANREPLPALVIKLWSFQLLLAVAFSHSFNICHRDIKPENMLLDPDTHVLKLADYGNAKFIRLGDRSRPYQVTRYYRAPELCLNNDAYGLPVDVWSVACVLAGFAAGRVFLEGNDKYDQIGRIAAAFGAPSEQQLRALCPRLANRPRQRWPPQFAKQLAGNNSAKPWRQLLPRAHADDALLTSLLDAAFQYDPAVRLRAVDAIQHHYYDELRKPGATLPNGGPLPLSAHQLAKSTSKCMPGARDPILDY